MHPICHRCKGVATLAVHLADSEGPQCYESYPLCQRCLDALYRETPGLADFGPRWEATPRESPEASKHDG